MVKKRSTFVVAPVLLAALAALLAGCGSSKSSSTSSSVAAATGTPAAAGTSTPTATASTPSYSAPAPGGAAGSAAIVTKPSKLGTIVAAGPKKLTVYLFEGDKGAQSACSGACANVWPPVTTAGAPQVAGGAVAADLGTIARPDGTKQVTYKGHPLYFFARDKDSGDAYGEGSRAFGAGWYVLRPSGTKIDKS